MARPWDRWERVLFNRTNAALERSASVLEKLIEEQGPGAVNSAAFWATHKESLFESILEGITGISKLGVRHGEERLLRGQSGLVDWGLVNRNVERYAREQATFLINGITDTLQDDLRGTLGDWTLSGGTTPDLKKRVREVIVQGGLAEEGEKPTANRASRIAVTESTNLYAQGNNQAWEAAGVEPAIFLPTLHPNCRCYPQPWRMPDGTWVVVWYTARDERVCKKEYPTPWGVVKGCKGMHKRVVSGGQYGGRYV